MRDESYTYWSAGEMRQLKEMRAQGWTIQLIASKLGRSEGAIKSRLYYLDIARLTTVKDDAATLASLKKKTRQVKKNYDDVDEHKPKLRVVIR